MGLIHLENMEFYSYHGHYQEEKVIGNKFIVNLIIETDLQKAGRSDKLEDTINYQELYNLVKNEMQFKSDLLEHIALSILESIFNTFKEIQKINIKISKMNPPLGGKIEKVSVTLSKER